MGKKIYIFIILFVVLIAIGTGIFFIVNNIENNTVFVPNSNAQIKNVEKYEKKLIEEYQKDGKKEEFLKVADEMQEKSLTYVLDNLTESADSFNTNVKNIQKMYDNNEYSKLGIDYNSVNYWVGTWTIDEKGNVKFKFASASIKPMWTTDNNVNNYII